MKSLPVPLPLFLATAFLSLAVTATAAESVRVDRLGYVQDSFLLRQAKAGGRATLTNFVERLPGRTRPMGAKTFRRVVDELRESFPEEGVATAADCGRPVRIAWSHDHASPRVVQFCADGSEPGTAGLRAWYADIQPLR